MTTAPTIQRDSLGVYKWSRTVPVPDSLYPRTEVHSSGTFAGRLVDAPAEARRRGILESDGWTLGHA